MTGSQVAGQTPVSELMADIIVRVAPNATVLDAVDALAASDVGVVAIMERGKVLGVLSERDVVGAVAQRQPLDATPAIDVASKDLAWCDAGATVTDVANEMSERFIRHVLVERQGKLVGIVSGRDLLGFYASEDAELEFDVD